MTLQTRGATADCTPWSAAECARLRAAYTKGGIRAALLALPRRTEKSLYKKARRLGLRRHRGKWTELDFARLRKLWNAEMSLRQIAKALARAWGFTVKSEIVWEKLTKHGKPHFGMGRYVRASHEICLVATRGRVKVDDRSVRSRFSAPVGLHSEKPEAIFDIAERLSPGPYVELFARRRRAGWIQFGNQLPEVA